MLVVVHPGSACGSADFNLGLIPASQYRDRMARTIHDWDGEIVVVDGVQSSEIPVYAQISLALENAKERVSGFRRIEACWSDDDWQNRVYEEMGDGAGRKALVTGAWYHREDDGGCVNAVLEVLGRRGYEPEVSPCALPL